jgi:hypothetical protein
MPRPPRMAMGGLAYHVLNPAKGRAMLFEKPADYVAFASERVPAIKTPDPFSDPAARDPVR